MGRKRKTEDKPIKCIIPKVLIDGLREMINTVSGKKISDVQYWQHLRILDLISDKQDLNKDNGYVKLNAKMMADNIGSYYAKALNHLLILGILEYKKNDRGTASYSTDTHESIKYRYTDTFRGEEQVLMKAYKRVHKTKPKKDLVDSHTAYLLAHAGYPEYAWLHGNLHKLTIDIAAVEVECNHWLEIGAFIKGKKFTDVRAEQYLRKAYAINKDAISYTIKLSGKIYTPLVKSPRVIRPHLILKDYDGVLLQSDVSSTHVLLALPFMREYRSQLTSIVAIEELNMIEKLIANKMFYQVISEQLRAEGVTIVDEKGDFLRRFCNSEIKFPNSYKTAFAKLYPAFTAFINHLRNGKPFTTVMNPIEAKLFNNRIAHRVYKELGSQTFMAGIFDAFIYREEDKEAIEKIMDEEVFRATGLRGMVKTSTLKEEAEKVITYPERTEENNEQLDTELFTTSLEGEYCPFMQIVKDDIVSDSKSQAFQQEQIKEQEEAKVIDIDAMTDDEFFEWLSRAD